MSIYFSRLAMGVTQELLFLYFALALLAAIDNDEGNDTGRDDSQ